MNPVAAKTSTSLVEAINFLTRPLAPFTYYSTLNSLQQILLSTFIALPAWRRNAHLTFTFTSSGPPHAISVACIATRVNWSDWYYALGGRAFDLTIERTSVSVQASGISGRAVIWKDAPVVLPTFLPHTTAVRVEPKSHRHSSIFSQSALQRVLSKVDINSVPSRVQPKTLAQQLLQSEHEMEEADEIFAMISNLDPSLISPTPAYDRFIVQRASAFPCLPPLSVLDEEICHSQSTVPKNFRYLGCTSPSPLSSPESSRSNSPSSIPSAWSSKESLNTILTPPFPPTSPIKVTKSPQLVSKFDPSCSRREPQILREVNPTTKNQVQRYLYQGGESKVLTGGVMLGTTTTTNPPTHRSLPGLKFPVAPPRMRNSTSKHGCWRHSLGTGV